MMRTSQTPLSSAVPALFIAALLAPFVAAAAGAADVPLPPKAPVVVPVAPVPLTAERFQKILALNQANGLDQVIAEPFATALHLGRPGEKIVAHQTLIDLGPNKVIFSQLQGNGAGYTIGLVANDGIYIFRLDEDLNFLVGAQKLIGADVTVIPDAQAKRNLAVVFDLLARIADKLEVSTKP